MGCRPSGAWRWGRRTVGVISLVELLSRAEQPLGSTPAPEDGGSNCVAPCQEQEHGVPPGAGRDGGGERDGRDGSSVPNGLRDPLCSEAM